MTKMRTLIALCTLFLFLSSCKSLENRASEDGNPSAGGDEKTSQWNLEDNNLVLEGYDIISYFDGAPVKGTDTIQTEHQGHLYYFSSEENRDKFAKTPEDYPVAYGGWCAWAMVDGKKVGVDPETYKIQDGELLLFYNGLWGNTLKSWDSEDPGELAGKADIEWEKIQN